MKFVPVGGDATHLSPFLATVLEHYLLHAKS